MGRTEATALDAHFLTLNGNRDGAISPDGLVAGCYLHGLFHNEGLRHALLSALGWRGPGEGTPAFDREREFDRLAQHVRSHLDMDRVYALVWPEDARTS